MLLRLQATWGLLSTGVLAVRVTIIGHRPIQFLLAEPPPTRGLAANPLRIPSEKRIVI